MHVRSFSPIKGYLIIAVVLTVLIIYWTFDTLTPAQRCELARAKIEVYEKVMMDPERYLYNSDKKELIAARVEEIKWCEHLLSNGN